MIIDKEKFSKELIELQKYFTDKKITPVESTILCQQFCILEMSNFTIEAFYNADKFNKKETK